jgi:hypothetical protein
MLQASNAANQAPHPQRRLGLRVPTRAWALFRNGAHGMYATVVELSATGLVLKFTGQRLRMAAFRPAQRFGLDLFLPGGKAPLHVGVRPVRTIGEFEAFEFVEASAVDRLTLAEYLDRVIAGRRRAAAWRRRQMPASPPTLAGAWKRLLLGAPNAPLAH